MRLCVAASVWATITKFPGEAASSRVDDEIFSRKRFGDAPRINDSDRRGESSVSDMLVVESCRTIFIRFCIDERLALPQSAIHAAKPIYFSAQVAPMAV
jgi:hypothetical protein